MPLFSFVIPTRNRARYLQFALQSCLEQEFDDYEIIISDNNSSDSTKEVVRRFDNGKVRYFNTEKDVGLTDNFENGITKAKGEYVLMLADDEAYVRSALRQLEYWIGKTNAPAISFGRTPFLFPGLPGLQSSADENKSGILYVRPFTRKVAWVPSSHALEIAFSLKTLEEGYCGRALPLSVKSVVRKDVIEAITRKVGCFQIPPTPDWSSAIMILNHVDKLLLLDKHLLLAGEVAESTGPNFKRKRQTDSIIAKDTGVFTHLTPLKTYTLTNLCVNAMLSGQAAYSPKSKYDIDYAQYFLLIEKDLEVLRKNGVDVTEDLKELSSALRQYNLSHLRQHHWVLAARLHDRFFKIINRLFTINLWYSSRIPTHLLSRWPLVFEGRYTGFSNILDCARIFDQLTKDINPDRNTLHFFHRMYGSCELLDHSD